MKPSLAFPAAFLCLLSASILPCPGQSPLILRGHEGSVQYLRFASDGNRLVTGSDDQSLRLWDVATGREITRMQGHLGPVTSIDIHPDGSSIASGSADGTVRLWDASDGKPLGTFQTGSEGVTELAFHPSGSQIVAGTAEGILVFLDASTGATLRSISTGSESIAGIAFHPDGALLATASGREGQIKLWDASTGRERASLNGHSNLVDSVAFSPDGIRLASGSWDNSIKLWDTSTGRELSSLDGHSNWVTSVAFSPDGSSIVSGSWDDTVKLWDLSSGETLATFEEHDDTVACVAFSPDGRRFASGSWDNTAMVWDLERARAAAQAADEAERLYDPLLQSARLLERRPALLPASFGVPILAALGEKTVANASENGNELQNALQGFIDTKETNDFVAEKNENFKSAVRARDALSRNLFILQALANRAAGSFSNDPQGVVLVGEIASKWEETVSSFLRFYPNLDTDTDAVNGEQDLKRKEWLKHLRLIARRQVVTAEDFLRSAPSADAIRLLPEDDQSRMWSTLARLHCREADY